MSYQVLARKWRPRTFHELIGQEHAVRALSNALDHGRLHHAFLFTGTRGVGKTTLSRILAKSLNCEQGVSSTPCGECRTCVEVDQGRFVDLIEVDAASRTKVEDTRELLDNVQYAPTRGRYKVYLIDEVHMLSAHSFNALLKTLEEPPPHVKFLLATTDPQKLPVTILSRCLQFSLKRLPEGLIASHLATLLEREQIAFEPRALALLARAGEGSMRDALSLLDQAIAFGGGAITAADVSEMLGTIDPHQVLRLAEAVLAADARGVLSTVEDLARDAADFAAVLADLASLWQRLALMQMVPEAGAGNWIDDERLTGMAAEADPEQLQLCYQITVHGRRDLALAPDPRAGLEMTLLRMLAFHPVEVNAAAGRDAPAQRRRAPPSSPASAQAHDRPRPDSRPSTAGDHGSAPRGGRRVPSAAAAAPSPEEFARSAVDPDADWHGLVERMGLGGIAGQLAMNCHLVRREAGRVVLSIGREHLAVRSPSAEARLQQALQGLFGEPVSLEFQVGEEAPQGTPAAQRRQQQEARRQAAEASIRKDPHVQALRERFGAEFKPDSIIPQGN